MNIETGLSKIERDKNGALPRMTPAQHKRVCSLIRKTCCNYIDGECIALKRKRQGMNADTENVNVVI